MAKLPFIELGQGRDLTRIPILFEDRSVIAVDKPAGWLLVPFSWQLTQRNLQAALTSSIAAGDFWARSRSLKFLKNVHRLDGDTSGVLLLAKSPGALETYGDLFETRRMEKRYLAVVEGVPKQSEWICTAPIAPDPERLGLVLIDPREGKESETAFRVLARHSQRTLIEAWPRTGRTHQIRVHLLEAGLPVVGDDLYGREGGMRRPSAKQQIRFPLGLRAVSLAYFDPFRRQPVSIQAPEEEFVTAFGFPATVPPHELARPGSKRGQT